MPDVGPVARGAASHLLEWYVMERSQPNEPLAVEIRPDRMSATLTVPPGQDLTHLDENAVLAALREADVAPLDDWRVTIRDGLARLAEAPSKPMTLVFHGIPPTHGEDGRFVWDAACDPDNQPEPKADEAGTANFYAHSAFIVVKKGQRIGQRLEPTAGVDGRTVTGEPVAAHAGKEAAIRIDDESIQIADDGTCTALHDGVLHHDEDPMHVDPCLQVDDNVDFSTGHIDFAGDVNIARGVRDLFRVKATGCVRVNGLIEAGHIIAGLDFYADGGMAGREKGTVAVGRDMTARHLSGVQGSIRRHLLVQREIVNCRLSIGGDLQASQAAIVGGAISIAQCVNVRDLGAAAGQPTVLALGVAPGIDAALAHATSMIRKLDEQLEEVENELHLVSVHQGGAAGQGRVSELQMQKESLDQRRADLESRSEALRKAYEKRRRIDLTVVRMLHRGVMLVHDNQAAVFKQSWRGPLWIGRSGSQPDLVVRDLNSGRSTSILEFATMRVLSPDDPLHTQLAVQPAKLKCA